MSKQAGWYCRYRQKEEFTCWDEPEWLIDSYVRESVFCGSTTAVAARSRASWPGARASEKMKVLAVGVTSRNSGRCHHNRFSVYAFFLRLTRVKALGHPAQQFIEYNGREF